ncbi:MAG: NADH-quinone oxidoreductase subunit L [Oligoflexia bacterium]|nr:NADH-quinone oxidoreductase subunit L [Bdellovibrionales bacterium]MYE07190.1 NADH-quinone oxidoreductase subunit L [Oligoflexia bacterium]
MMKIALIALLMAPLIGALINGLRWKQTDLKLAGFIGVTSCFISFLSAIYLFIFILAQEKASFFISFSEWLHIYSFKVSFSFLVDPLSVLMLLLITGVGFLIHLFSVYYMSDDKGPAKYFSYLNLFVFSMLVLVSADNLFLMFLGWEGVGLCSYLLIGFWFTDKQKAAAGMKAFIVNRIGDVGFLLGMFLLFGQFASLQFDVLSEGVGGPVHLGTVKWACFFLFMGVIGKSAQIPLYIWLPSAMAGPTPVSALIHAATMVTAGIYLMVRMHSLFILAPEVLTLISWIGAMTAMLTAFIACAQSDIKKVLAYSTVSQLGYMCVAVGVGAFTASLFHLMTHAFFKALLFLAAGSVIHALKGEQNIYNMGGLRKKLPVTWLCFLVGFLALIGLPPFSGFFSKDEILWSAWSSGQFAVFSVLLLTAFITAFYMSRLYTFVFHGDFKPGIDPQEGGFFAKAPLIILAVLSLLGGFLGIPHLISAYLPGHPPHGLEEYLKPVLIQKKFEGSFLAESVLMIGSSVLVLSIVLISSWFYLKRKKELLFLKKKNQVVFNALEAALGVDSFCYSKIVRPVLNISHDLWWGVDVKIIQGFILLIQKKLITLQELFESIQNGKTQRYILFMILGLIICILSLFLF